MLRTRAIRVKTGTDVATNRSNTLQQQISSCEQENFIENFVATTEFCRCNTSHKVKPTGRRMQGPQNRDYNRSFTQVYNVAPLLPCACCSTHLIYLLGRWRRRLSLVCNNQNHVMPLKFWMVIRLKSYYRDLMNGNY